MPAPSIKRPLLIFAIFYVAWCYFVIRFLARAVASEQLNNHALAIAYLLCLLPLPFFGVYLYIRTK
jgi:hypothetical protein